MHVPGADRRRVRCSRRATRSTCWSASTRRPSTCTTTSWPTTGTRLRRRVGAGHARVRVPLVRGRRWARSPRRPAATGAARTWCRSGSSAGCSGIDTARIEEMILKRYAHKGDVGESNIRSLRAGFEHARDDLPEGAHKLGAPARDRRRPRARVGQPGDLPRRPARGTRLLRRLPDHAGQRHPRVAGGPAAALRRRRDPDRGRDRRARFRARRLVRGQEGDDGHLRARACR